MNKDELIRALSHVKPNDAQTERIEKVREAAKAYAEVLYELCPASREFSVAVQHLLDCNRRAVAAIVLE